VETTPPEPVKPTLPTEPVLRIDLPYYRPPYRPPVRHWYPPVGGGTTGSPDGQRVPPFGPPPVYVMPPVWTGTPYRPWPPYGGVPLPPIPPDLWGREPWWFRGPVLRGEPVRYREIEPPTPPKRPWYEVLPFKPGDPRPDMPSTQPVYDSAPPPEPISVQPPEERPVPITDIIWPIQPPKQEPPLPPPPSEPKPIKITQPTWDYWDYPRGGIERD
jgi:hypothetical protein